MDSRNLNDTFLHSPWLEPIIPECHRGFGNRNRGFGWRSWRRRSVGSTESSWLAAWFLDWFQSGTRGFHQGLWSVGLFHRIGRRTWKGRTGRFLWCFFWMKLVILLPTLDSLRDFHKAPPLWDLSQCYHRVIISTTNSLKDGVSDLASYVQLLDSDATQFWWTRKKWTKGDPVILSEAKNLTKSNSCRSFTPFRMTRIGLFTRPSCLSSWIHLSVANLGWL